MLPVTRKVVAPNDPCISAVRRFDVLATFNVVQLMNGIVRELKLNTVFVAFDVIPAVNKFVVVKEFEAYKLPVMFRDVCPVVPVMVTVERFDIPYTFRVLVPYTTAEFTVR